LAFAPNYSPATNQFTSIPGVTVSYDANGNLLTDNLNTYTWDPYWGNMLTVNNGSAVVTATYDALGRMVESNAGGTYSEFVYGPTGVKLAKVNGTTLINAFVALPGGAKAIYNSSGALTYYRHSDWLGSSRLASTQSRRLYSSTSYAPFGEQYAVAGTADASFTGQDQDTVKSLYDFPARRQSPSQGRWISPDPAGIGAVIIASPQSWNRYAYVLNNPLALTDPTGLSVRNRHHRAHRMDDGDDDDDDDDDDDGDDNDDTCDAQCQQQQQQQEQQYQQPQDPSYCGAQYSFSDCGGLGAILSGTFGNDLAALNQLCGGMSANMCAGVLQYEAQVAQSFSNDPCVYVNDAGNGVDKNGVDPNSSPGECQATLGQWIPPQPPGTTYGVDANGNVFPVSPLTASPQPSWLDNHPCVIPGAIALGVDIGDLFTEGALTPWAVSYSAQALACDAIM
jgi:RHS repeat-associated protein